MGSNPVALTVDGEDVQLSAYQVRHMEQHWELVVTGWVIKPVSQFVFPLRQFNKGGFYKFDKENITVSIGDPPVARNFSLEMGKRQTLHIPSANIDELELVSL